jgi:starch-binding outer membrane protein, SusD/RagB family
MKRICYFLLVSCALLGSCKKYLAKVSDQSLVVPSTVSDYRKLLDNKLMTLNSTPGLGALGVDDYFLPYTDWLSLGAPEGTAYNWQVDIFDGQSTFSWNNPYEAIYYCNVVLGGIGTAAIDSSGKAEYYAVWGSALFYRAFHHFLLEETFGQPYRPATAATDAGIPLRLTVVPSQPETRSSVASVFQQLLNDLRQSLSMLPTAVQWSYRNRPCRPAAFALLSRICLTMQDYSDAQAYADSSLNGYGTLVDYNTVDSTKGHPFPAGGNNEVLFQCSAYNYPVLYSSEAEIDTTLYRSYDPNDLRRAIFFKPAPSEDGGVLFKGSYTGQVYLFSGLSVDEVWLIRAECKARAGDVTGSLNDLNALLINRWRTGTFQQYTTATVATADQALTLVLAERRKETLCRELRWFDLRRLNQDARTAVTLIRILGAQTDTLAPQDNRYAYPIPDSEIQLGGIPQNPR